MTFEITLLLGLIAIAVVFFSFDWVPADVVAPGLLIALPEWWIAFAAILTSSVSLISTSSNLVVSGLMTNAGLEPMGMFELSPVGIPIAIVGLTYMFLVGRHWVPNRTRAIRTGIIFGGALTLAAFKVVSLPVAMLLGAFCTFATRCVSPADAYREGEWRVIILIASMLALGETMTATGTAQYLAELVARGTAGLHPLWLLGGVFLLTVVLTQPMSNQAAAAVILPIALQTAQQLNLNLRTFAMMIAVAASCSRELILNCDMAPTLLCAGHPSATQTEPKMVPQTKPCP